MFLEECTPIIQEYFPDNWMDSYSFSSPEEVESANTDLITRITTITNPIFEKLNFSVLCGEYLIDPNIEDSIRRLESLIDNLISDTQDKTTDEFNHLISFFLTGFVSPLRIALQNYSGHIKSIKRKYQTPERKSLFEAISIKKFSIPDDIPLSSVRILVSDFINVNLKLSIIDHTLVVRAAQLQDLILIYHTIDERVKKTEDDVLTILRDKCSYLIKKVLIRFDKDPRNYYYALDFDDKPINKDEFDPGVFIDYYTSTSINYSEKENDNGEYSELKTFTHEIDKKIKKGDSVFFEDYFRHIKYFKENNHASCSKIADSIKSYRVLEDSYDLPSLSFDKWAYRVSLNYLVNNRISFDISNESISIQNFANHLKEIRIEQHDTGIKNYFPYLKIFHHIILLCESELQKLQDQYNFQEIQKKEREIKQAINELDKIEKELYLNFEWCSDRAFLPFQVPKKECVKTIQIKSGKSLDLFLSSSFILPINFEKVKRDISDESRNLSDLKLRLATYNTLREEKEQIIKIKAAVEKTDRRQIEILSIFAAIVLFVSSNIQIFSKAETITDALRFMLLFAYVLILFVLAIWLISRDNGFKFTFKNISVIHMFFMALITIATIVALFIIYPDYKNKPISNSTETNKTIGIENKK